MKIVLIGGHISPALAVLDRLKPGVEVVFFGRKTVFENDDALSYEYQEIVRRKVKFVEIKTGRFQRKLTTGTLPSLLRVPGGVSDAYKALKKEKPDCVVSFGGYIGLTVALAARTLGIPVVIHEQTAAAGLSNKIAGKFAKRICISWESSQKFFPKEKTVLTGNPLRLEFTERKTIPQKYNPPMIYITGGSAGSHELNVLVEKNLEKMLEDYTIVHQTGQASEFGDFVRLDRLRENLPVDIKKRYTITKFTTATQAADFMRDSSLIISRSGINAVTEFIFLEKKAYLVPLTHGQQNEQLTNARFLSKLGLAKIYHAQDDFVSEATEMIKGEYKLKDKSILELVKNAPERIISVIYDTAQKS